MNVKEILESGRYTDRQGREWAKVVPLIEWFCWEPVKMLQPSEMRLLIERDQHRDVCPSLRDCNDHPVPFIETYNKDFRVVYTRISVTTNLGRYLNIPEAMDAARALAVGE